MRTTDHRLARPRSGRRRHRPVTSAAFAAAVSVLAAAGCTSVPRPAPVDPGPTATHCEVLSRPSPGRTGDTLSPEDFGADGTDTADDTVALQAALDALGDGDTLVLPAGRTYRHSGVLRIRNDGSGVHGPGHLFATAERTSAVYVDGDRVTLGGGLVLSVEPTKRWSEHWNQAKLVLFRSDGAVLDNILVDGSAAAGVHAETATNFTITDVAVRDTMADGIHMTGGSIGGTVVRSRVCDPHDDGVAVVSYGGQPLSGSITVEAPMVRDQHGGRGLSVVGGQNVEYRDINVIRSDGAAVYIAAEGEWATQGVAGVRVLGGTVTEANTDPVDTAHGAVIVYASAAGQRIENVEVSDLEIVDTHPQAPWVVGLNGNGAAMADIRMDRLDISGTRPTRVLRSLAGLPVISGWTLDGAPYP